MLQKQLSKYDGLRKRILASPGHAAITSKQKIMTAPSYISLNFPISYKLWPEIMRIVGELEKIDPGHGYLYPLTFHCTIKSCGILGENVSQDDIPAIISKISTALKDFKSFEVTLRGFNSFTTNTFIQVFSSDDKLFQLHNLLNGAIDYKEPEFEVENYVPHIAVIYYYHKPSKLFSVLNEYSDTLIGEIRVDKVNLIKWTSSLVVNRMEVMKTFKLK